ncbi:unnamed protein product, partial [Mesorhabditis belari]|uniref:C-type lectin domain-containing protein n=1 Tax=Mesorhabditis belari TaxID=2138241 RepID=A0AAF3J248_9BILA
MKRFVVKNGRSSKHHLPVTRNSLHTNVSIVLRQIVFMRAVILYRFTAKRRCNSSLIDTVNHRSIGFHKVGNTWEWTDKTEVDYTFWMNREPKDHGNQLPIAAFTYLFDENKWWTGEKNETSGYICKYPLK